MSVEATRVMIFLDGPNIYWGRDRYNRLNNANLMIDYLKLIKLALGNRRLIRACFYLSKRITPVDPDHVKFVEYLRAIGVQVHEKELKEYTDYKTGEIRRKEKGVDVGLAVDLLDMAWEDVYDVAVLISGDGDYVGAVDKVLSKGKNVEVVAFRGTLADALRKMALKVTYIDDIVSTIQKI